MNSQAMNHVYVTAAGAFLPGSPVSNDAMEGVLGFVGGKPSQFREKILRNNGIESRHYAIDSEGRQTHLNEQLAAEAVKRALAARGIGLEDVGMLAFGTTTPDVLMPGFTSMVHGRLGGGPLECLSAAGICASGAAALRSAVNAVRVGDHRTVVVGGSELLSPLMRATRFEKESELAPERGDVPTSFQYFNADFLRWMLSDGAGALVLENKPRATGLSLRVDWVEMRSYANQYPTCMYHGLGDPNDPRVGKTYQSYATISEADRDGLFVIRQDTRLLAEGIPFAVAAEAKRLREEGKIEADKVDWLLPHISSYFFRGALVKALADAGTPIPESRWFTNLKTRGNTGAASIFIMLEECVANGLFEPGQRILAMIPESGRFTVSYAMFTAVAPEQV